MRRTPEHVVSTRFETGDGVLVDLNARRYYTLNETAMLVWSALEEGCDDAGLAARLAHEFDVTAEKAHGSAQRLLGDLRQLGLLESPT